MPGWRRIAGMPEVRGAWLRRCRIACERRRMGRGERNLTTSDLLVRARQRGRRGSTCLRTGQGGMKPRGVWCERRTIGSTVYNQTKSNSNPSLIFSPLFHSYEGLSSCFFLIFHNELQQISHTYTYTSNSLIFYSYQVTTMRIILNYRIIFARFICNGQISNSYFLNGPFSEDRVLDGTIHNDYISNCYFQCPVFQQLYFE